MTELQAREDVEVMSTCGDIDSAIDEITRHEPDAVFLDIELKRGNAFQLLSRLKKISSSLPAIIIITGHSEFEYGVKSIEHRDCIIKILQKPFWEQFDDIFEDIKDLIFLYHRQKQLASNDSEVQFVKFNNRTVRMELKEILYLEVAGSGCTYASMSDGEVITIAQTMNQLLASLPDYFTRVSRFNAINIHKIKDIDHSENMIYLLEKPKGIGYSKSFYDAFAKRIGLR